MSRATWLLLLFGLASIWGCEQPTSVPAPVLTPPPPKVTSEDVRRDAKQAAETTAEYTRQTKDEFQKKLETRLAELDAETATLRARGAEWKGEAKENLEKSLAVLEQKRLAASAKLAEVRDSSGEAWKDLQQGAQAAWDDLELAFRQASTKF